jgi:phage baseplate assembly protein W
MATPPAFLGSGVRFPFRPGADGGFAFVDGEDVVAQSIVLILSTGLGERQMRFRFGSRLPQMIFEPINSATLTRIEEAVKTALTTLENRIRLVSVSAEPDANVVSRVNVTVKYDILSTNRPGNIVFPFYLQQGGT